MDGGELVGVISERDYARKVILQGRSSKDTPVRDIATEQPITISPECSVEEAMRLITTKPDSPPPVVCDGKVCGMVSIGDLVQWIFLCAGPDHRTTRALYRREIPRLGALPPDQPRLRVTATIVFQNKAG